MMPSLVSLSTVPPYRWTTAAQRVTSSVMISRRRSAPTAAAMSIECTTSANKTVTCLYSAGFEVAETAAPHSLQNLEFGGSSMPHAAQANPVAIMASPRPSRCGPRSQAFSPYRDSDPATACKRRYRREPAPVEPGVATARCRASPDPHRLARPLTARLRPPLRSRHPRPRDQAVSPPEPTSLERPTPAVVPRGTGGRRRRARAVWPHRDLHAEPS